MTNDELESLLQTLLDNGVAEFAGLGISVRFTSAAAPADSAKDNVTFADPKRAERAEEATSQWKHPSLWGPAGRPEFPKSSSNK